MNPKFKQETLELFLEGLSEDDWLDLSMNENNRYLRRLFDKYNFKTKLAISSDEFDKILDKHVDVYYKNYIQDQMAIYEATGIIIMFDWNNMGIQEIFFDNEDDKLLFQLTFF